MLAIVAGLLAVPAGDSSAASGSPEAIITDAGGATPNAGAAWLEQTAISQVLAEYQLPDSDADQVMTWARTQVRGQEWAELVHIILEAPAQRSAGEQSAYDWFEGKVRAVQVGDAEQAVDEYLKWSGLNESDYTTAEPLNYGPNGTGYCNFHAPGPYDSGTDPTYDGRSSAFCFPNCTLACAFASPPTPEVDDFGTWGTYDEQSAIVGATAAQQSDATLKAIATAGGLTALSSAGAFAGVLIGNPTQVVTLTGSAAVRYATTLAIQIIRTAGRSALKLADLEDFYEAGEAIEAIDVVVSDAAPVVAAANVSVAAIVIGGLIDMAIETYNVIEAKELPGKLHDALAKAEDTSTPVDLPSMLASDDGADGLLGVLMANTNPVGTVTATPVAASDADQHFEVTSTDSTAPTVQRTVSLMSGLSPAGLEVRPTASNWFVTSLFDATDGSPLGSIQALSFPFISWSGFPAVASVHRDADGTDEFQVGLEYDSDDPVDTTDPTTQCELLTGTTSCSTKALQVTLSTGAKATIQLVPTPVTPSVNSVGYGPQVATDTVDAGVPISFVATGTDPRGLALTYTWSFPWQCGPSYYTDPLTEASRTGLCVEVGGKEPPTVVHGPIAGHTFYATGAQTVTVTATNSNGESTTRQLSVTALGDTTAPTVTFANTPAAPTGSNGWYTSAVHGTVVAADPAATGQGSSGVRTLACTDQVTGGVFDLTSDGTYQVSCAANDTMGNNSAIHTDTVKIDTAPPTALETVGGGAGAVVGDNGWYRQGPVTEGISIQDAACPIVVNAGGTGDSTVTLGRTVPTPYTCEPSGLATSRCPGMTGANGQYSVTLVADGSVSPTCTATDKAGNTASFTLPIRGIDSTPPDLTLSVQPSSVLVGATPPALMPHPADSGSGLASVSCDPAGTATAGTVTVSCRASDKAGNTTSASATYTVGYAVSAAVDPTGGGASTVPVTVTVSDTHGRLTDSAAAALATDCQVTVGLDAAAAAGKGCATYDTTQHAFTASIAIPDGSTGSHHLVIDVRSGSTVVGDDTIPLDLDTDGTPQLPLPVAVTSPPRDQTVPEGQTAAFAATAQGTPRPTQRWQISTDAGATWSDIDGATDTVLTLPGVTKSMDGNEYRAVFTNTLGTVITPAATLTVGSSAAPIGVSITSSPTDQVAAVGGSATFTVTATPPPSRVQWQQSTDGGGTWTDVPGSWPSTSDTLTVPDVTATMDGTRVRVELFSSDDPDQPTGISTGATLHVAAGPSITLPPKDETVGGGATASFSAAATGEPTPQIGWQVSTDAGAHWSPVAGSPGNPSVLQIPSVTADMTGYEYEAVADNASGVIASAPATLTVLASASTDPRFGVSTSPQDQLVPMGADATFTAAAAGTPIPTVQWQFQPAGAATWTPIDGAVATTLTVPRAGTAAGLTPDWNADGTSYRAVFTAQDGSRRTATTDAATLAVATPPRIILEPVDVTGRTRGAFTAAASGSPAPTVQWQHRVGANWVTITGATTDSLVPLDASGTAYRAIFTNPAGTAITTAATYTASATGDVPPMVILSPTDQTVAAGTAATFTSLPSRFSAPTVQWQSSTDGTTWTDIAGATSDTLVTGTLTTADSGTRYRAEYTSDGGTAISLPATVTVTGPDPAAPAVTTQPQNQQAQVGSSATFSAAASGVPAPTVQWQTETDGAWQDIPGATAATLVLGSVTADMQRTYYRAVFTNASGQATTDPAGLAVYQPLAVATTSLPGATAGTPFSLQLRSSGGSDEPQSWYLPDGSALPPGLILSPDGLLSGVPSAAGHFTFTVEVGDPAAATLTLVVAAAPPPTETGATGTGSGDTGTTSPESTPTSSGTGSNTAGTRSDSDGTGTGTRTTAAAGTGGNGTSTTSGALGARATTGALGTGPTSSAGAGQLRLGYTGVPVRTELISGIGLLLIGWLILLTLGRRRRRARHC